MIYNGYISAIRINDELLRGLEYMDDVPTWMMPSNLGMVTGRWRGDGIDMDPPLSTRH